MTALKDGLEQLLVGEGKLDTLDEVITDYRVDTIYAIGIKDGKAKVIYLSINKLRESVK